MLLEDMIERRLLEVSVEATAASRAPPDFGGTTDEAKTARRLAYQPWPADAQFQRGRLDTSASACTDETEPRRDQSISVEDIKYERREDVNQFYGVARLVIDFSVSTAMGGDLLVSQKEAVAKLRYVLRQLNNYAVSVPNTTNSRVLSCTPVESAVIPLDDSLGGYFGSAIFTVRFIESEDLT